MAKYLLQSVVVPEGNNLIIESPIDLEALVEVPPESSQLAYAHWHCLAQTSTVIRSAGLKCSLVFTSLGNLKQANCCLLCFFLLIQFQRCLGKISSGSPLSGCALFSIIFNLK